MVYTVTMKFITGKQSEKLHLTDITLVCIDCVNLDRAIYAIETCTKKIEFGKILLLTDIPNSLEYSQSIEKITSRMEYSVFCLASLPDYIKTKFCLLIQHDGFIINPTEWNNDWLKYDYIGSPFSYNKNMVGNGGFSLRSNGLLKLCKSLYLQTPIPDFEDTFICWTHREKLKSLGIKFATLEVARKFGSEFENEINSQFGFHNKDFSIKYRIKNNSLRSRIEVNSILYGIDGQYTDVTDRLHNYIINSNYVVYNDNNYIDKICNDPIPNTHKNLVAHFNINGIHRTAIIKSGDYINLLSSNY